MDENNAAQPGLTDDEIEALAKKHIAPHADRLDKILPHRVPYQQTEQFRRVKALIGDLLSKLRAEGVQAGDEREAFEAAVQAEYGVSALSLLLRDADGDYVTMNTEWVFWLRRAALASSPVADESPMAKMADALREKGRQEQQAYQDSRVQSTEWGPMPHGTEADLPASAPVAGEADNTDYIGLALELESAAKRVESQTVQRAIEAGAHGLRLAYSFRNAAPQASEAVRNQALEQAAATVDKLAELSAHRYEKMKDSYSEGYMDGQDATLAALRALKTQADKDGGDCAKGAGDELRPLAPDLANDLKGWADDLAEQKQGADDAAPEK